MSTLEEKIAALHAKAQSTNNEHEAQIFADKVQELLIKHNLSMSDIKIGQKPSNTGVYVRARNMNPWRELLISCLANAYFTKVVKVRSVEGFLSLCIIGKEDNSRTTCQMYEHLEQIVIHASRKFSKKRKSQLAFQRGMGTRVAQRIIQRHHDMIRRNASDSRVPALFKSEQELNQEVAEEMFGKIEPASDYKQRKESDPFSYLHGAEQGNDVDITPEGSKLT